MELGIFSKTYQGDLETVLRKMANDNLHFTQLNLISCGMETMPLFYSNKTIDGIVKLAKKYDIHFAALSGTFNMIDPDEQKKQEGIKRFQILCEIARYLDIPIITLCTGSKNKDNKWKWDDENLSEKAWLELLETTEELLGFAQKYDLILGIETETGNIINTPEKARRYLDYFHNKHLKIIMDAANLFCAEQLQDMKKTLHHAFKLLGNDICLAHAKDLQKLEEIHFVAAGQGILDFQAYLQLLKQYGYNGPLIMHGLREEQVSDSVNYLKEWI